MASFGVFSLAKQTVVFGALELKDMPSDSWIKVKPPAATFGVIEGACGGMTRYETGSTKYEVVLKFKKSSKENKKLSAWHIADAAPAAAGTGVGVTSFAWKDGTGETFLVSSAAWIPGMPEGGASKEVGDDVEWTIHMQVTPGGYFLGGHQI